MYQHQMPIILSAIYKKNYELKINKCDENQLEDFLVTHSVV